VWLQSFALQTSGWRKHCTVLQVTALLQIGAPRREAGCGLTVPVSWQVRVVALYPEATSSETQIFLSILQNLILGLERGAGRQEFKAAFEECRSHAAESLSIDEKFATDELSWLALRLIREEIINDWNLRVALSNAPIRKFIALSLLQRATELYPLRTRN
jgi:hypothetical protein